MELLLISFLHFGLGILRTLKFLSLSFLSLVYGVTALKKSNFKYWKIGAEVEMNYEDVYKNNRSLIRECDAYADKVMEYEKILSKMRLEEWKI